jgi:hypothetical protein
VEYLLSRDAYPQVIDTYHLRKLAEWRAVTYIGADYKDADDKIRFLEAAG